MVWKKLLEVAELEVVEVEGRRGYWRMNFVR